MQGQEPVARCDTRGEVGDPYRLRRCRSPGRDPPGRASARPVAEDRRERLGTDRACNLQTVMGRLAEPGDRGLNAVAAEVRLQPLTASGRRMDDMVVQDCVDLEVLEPGVVRHG